MKIILALALLFLFQPLAAINSWLYAADTYAVQVKTAQLREAPSFAAKILAAVNFGEELTVEKIEKAWALASFSGSSVKGWLHESALTDKKISLSSGRREAQVSVDEREVSIAGKGFDRQTEQSYRVDNPNGYAQVEAMQSPNFTAEASLAFLKAGKEN